VPNLVEMETLARKYEGRLNLIALNVEKNAIAAKMFFEQHKITAGQAPPPAHLLHPRPRESLFRD
jgi:hypothetical protein